MAIGDKMKGFLEQSAHTSKELASKASAKAQNLGEQGVLLLEIKKLKAKIEKLKESLGREVYDSFEIRNVESINKTDEEIGKILEEIRNAIETIDQKEIELRDKKDAQKEI